MARWGRLARAARYSPECFKEWGRIGGIETLVRHGKKFYREIRKKLKYYKKGYLTRKTKMRLRKKCERKARKEQGSVIVIPKSRHPCHLGTYSRELCEFRP